ncbi:MAG: NAD(P)/FAD-dependent oxidoreductase [Candidatus Dadabacteria bacterium]|nr:MAG: NAD(P)/FAD-dependent oxidoreductase [Candidatus Dadabacteria bacterium]
MSEPARDRYDAIVIGSGPGGSACASLLQKRGIRTLLLEKNSFIGGKMMSIKKDGYAYDFYPHGQVPMRNPAFQKIFEELGVPEEFRPALEPDDKRDVVRLAYRARGWKDYRILSQGQALTDPTPFFNLWQLNDPADQQKVVSFMTELATMPEAKLDELDNVTMDEFLSDYDIPYALYSYLAFHANASLAEPIDLVAASEQIRIMQHMMIHGGGGQYKGGFGSLAEVMVREFEKNGGTLIRNCKVERIMVENGSVTGVVTPKGKFYAPVVVSSAGLQPTVLKLVGEEHFDRSYVNYVRNLAPGWAFTSVRYFLREPVMDVAMYVAYSDDSWWNMERFLRVKEGHLPDEVILFMCNHSFYDDEAAPPGKQVLVSGTICSPDPGAPEIEGLWQKMDEMMQKYFPEIWAATERREYAGPREISEMTRDSVLPGQGGECVGLGQVVGQCGKMKPSVVAPIGGLYYAGADAGAAGMGTHQAAESGMKVATEVVHFLNKRWKTQ